MSNVLSFIPGMETIDFQAKSKLGNVLVEICQEALDYKHSLDFTQVLKKVEDDPKSQRVAKAMFTCDMMYKYGINTFSKQLKEVIKRETGFVVQGVIVDGGMKANSIGGTGVWTSPSSVAAWEAYVLDKKNAGFEMDVDPKYLDDNLIEALQKISSIVDEANSRMLTTQVETDKVRLDLSVTMSIDMTTLFCTDCFVYDLEENTAGEVAAVFLHEVGHVFEAWRRYADTYYIGRQMRNISIMPRTTMAKLFNDIDKAQEFVAKRVKTLKTNMIKTDATPQEVKQLIEKGEMAMRILGVARKLKSHDEIAGKEFLAVPVTLMFLYGILGYIFFMFIANWVCGFSEYNRRLHSFAENSLRGTKTSDSRSTSNNLFSIERAADEFAVRHGFGPELASGLNKLRLFFNKFRAGALIFTTQTNAASLEASSAFWRKFNPKAYFDVVTYENDTERNMRIKEDLLGLFRDPNFKELPGEIKRDLVDQVTRIDELLDESRDYFNSTTAKLVAKIARNLNPSEWLAMLTTGNIDSDFALLQNQLDAIDRNPLNYWAEKLKV